ncbi:LOW QUALITY PROTEIN: hypothetical protein U9M48_042255 [Paspalum notatum var. saurae]|uniref:Uncharacterized protein n=1 Tax=Paspalum notatum var. saurae TaxID=547442 RepID=A0AAQ3XF13_PASNO
MEEAPVGWAPGGSEREGKGAGGLPPSWADAQAGPRDALGRSEKEKGKGGRSWACGRVGPKEGKERKREKGKLFPELPATEENKSTEFRLRDVSRKRHSRQITSTKGSGYLETCQPSEELSKHKKTSIPFFFLTLLLPHPPPTAGSLPLLPPPPPSSLLPPRAARGGSRRGERTGGADGQRAAAAGEGSDGRGAAEDGREKRERVRVGVGTKATPVDSEDPAGVARTGLPLSAVAVALTGLMTLQLSLISPCVPVSSTISPILMMEVENKAFHAVSLLTKASTSAFIVALRGVRLEEAEVVGEADVVLVVEGGRRDEVHGRGGVGEELAAVDGADALEQERVRRAQRRIDAVRRAAEVVEAVAGVVDSGEAAAVGDAEGVGAGEDDEVLDAQVLGGEAVGELGGVEEGWGQVGERLGGVGDHAVAAAGGHLELPPVRTTLSRAAKARMSAQETTPGHCASTADLALSITLKKWRLGLFGGESFSAVLFAVESISTEPSQPCMKRHHPREKGPYTDSH